jgi:hypothetical protein
MEAPDERIEMKTLAAFVQLLHGRSWKGLGTSGIYLSDVRPGTAPHNIEAGLRPA